MIKDEHIMEALKKAHELRNGISLNSGGQWDDKDIADARAIIESVPPMPLKDAYNAAASEYGVMMWDELSPVANSTLRAAFALASGEKTWRPVTSQDELRVGDYLKVDVGHYSLEFKAPISMIDGDITFDDGHTYTWSNHHEVSYYRETSIYPDPAKDPMILVGTEHDWEVWLWDGEHYAPWLKDYMLARKPHEITDWQPAEVRPKGE